MIEQRVQFMVAHDRHGMSLIAHDANDGQN